MNRATVYAIATAVMFALAWVTPARGADIARADQLVHTFAPAATVTCDPALPATLFGGTRIASRQVLLGPVVCLGLFLYDATPAYRQLVHALNPTVNIEWAIGVGIVVTLHEAQHAAGVVSETVAQCRAMHYAQPLLAGDAIAWNMALIYDAALPAVYHDGTACDV